MARDIKITRLTVTHFKFEVADLGLEEKLGFDTVYQPGSKLSSGGGVLKIETDAGICGEVPGGVDGRTAQYLIGRSPLDRETIWQDLKRARRSADGTPPGAIDIALWDLAGKLYDAPLYELIGGAWRKKLPAYASTYHGDENGGLTSAEDYGRFALRCKEELGYPAFKIHGWVGGPIDREVAAVLAIREAVGDDMALMLDPAGAFTTFDDVLRVGRACDQARYMWYEDPFRGGGFSRFAHVKLRELISTPMLMGEHVRGLEAKADTIYTGATDYVRANANADGGITGVMKIAALAEAHGLDVELHGGGLAHRHCMAVLRHANYYELGLVHPEVADTKPPIYPERRWLDELDSVDGNGCVDVPEGPGLGVPFDWDFIDAHKTGETVFE
ncbi:MAG: mandelate racemase [Gemmatimonadetes bacterium]|jgi:L-alanine-DL-glutamate epimerase-like enolase superfamily enzyme|nr:mandelate racemase [Gemmatimonadota bacterium]